MNRKILYLIFTILILISCSSDNDIYKTKSGEFATKTGSFIAKFPTEPKLSVIENKIGLDEFEIYLYRSTLGIDKVFTVEYVDYPEYILKSTTDEQLYSQSITNLTNKMSSDFKLESQKPLDQHGLIGRYFFLEFINDVDRNKPYIEGMIFRKSNRIYTIIYSGIYDKHTIVFLNSFRLFE